MTPEEKSKLAAAVAEHGAFPMPVRPDPKPEATPLSPEQREQIADLIGDAKPATTGLVQHMAKAVHDRAVHEHPTWEDLYCLNLVSWMGERMGPVLRRLLDAEARVAELEAEPLAWASKLDAKSLDNFLIALGSFSEHEPMDEAIDRIHELLRSYREATSVDGVTWLLAPTQALREDEPAEEQMLSVFRASHESIVMGLYTSREAAREHCKKFMERENSALTLDWRPDGPWREGGDGEPGPYEAEELYEYGTHEASTWNPTGYVVTPLEVASEYDAEADE